MDGRGKTKLLDADYFSKHVHVYPALKEEVSLNDIHRGMNTIYINGLHCPLLQAKDFYRYFPELSAYLKKYNHQQSFFALSSNYYNNAVLVACKYHRVILMDKPPTKKDLDEDTLIMVGKTQSLTAYWLADNKLQSRTKLIDKVPEIHSKLLKVKNHTSNDEDLITYITADYDCAKPRRQTKLERSYHYYEQNEQGDLVFVEKVAITCYSDYKDNKYEVCNPSRNGVPIAIIVTASLIISPKKPPTVTTSSTEAMAVEELSNNETLQQSSSYASSAPITIKSHRNSSERLMSNNFDDDLDDDDCVNQSSTFFLNDEEHLFQGLNRSEGEKSLIDLAACSTTSDEENISFEIVEPTVNSAAMPLTSNTTTVPRASVTPDGVTHQFLESWVYLLDKPSASDVFKVFDMNNPAVRQRYTNSLVEVEAEIDATLMRFKVYSASKMVANYLRDDKKKAAFETVQSKPLENWISNSSVTYNQIMAAPDSSAFDDFRWREFRQDVFEKEFYPHFNAEFQKIKNVITAKQDSEKEFDEIVLYKTNQPPNEGELNLIVKQYDGLLPILILYNDAVTLYGCIKGLWSLSSVLPETKAGFPDIKTAFKDVPENKPTKVKKVSIPSITSPGLGQRHFIAKNQRPQKTEAGYEEYFYSIEKIEEYKKKLAQVGIRCDSIGSLHQLHLATELTDDLARFSAMVKAYDLVFENFVTLENTVRCLREQLIYPNSSKSSLKQFSYPMLCADNFNSVSIQANRSGELRSYLQQELRLGRIYVDGQHHVGEGKFFSVFGNEALQEYLLQYAGAEGVPTIASRYYAEAIYDQQKTLINIDNVRCDYYSQKDSVIVVERFKVSSHDNSNGGLSSTGNSIKSSRAKVAAMAYVVLVSELKVNATNSTSVLPNANKTKQIIFNIERQDPDTNDITKYSVTQKFVECAVYVLDEKCTLFNLQHETVKQRFNASSEIVVWNEIERSLLPYQFYAVLRNFYRLQGKEAEFDALQFKTDVRWDMVNGQVSSLVTMQDKQWVKLFNDIMEHNGDAWLIHLFEQNFMNHAQTIEWCSPAGSDLNTVVITPDEKKRIEAVGKLLGSGNSPIHKAFQVLFSEGRLGNEHCKKLYYYYLAFKRSMQDFETMLPIVKNLFQDMLTPYIAQIKTAEITSHLRNLDDLLHTVDNNGDLQKFKIVCQDLSNSVTHIINSQKILLSTDDLDKVELVVTSAFSILSMLANVKQGGKDALSAAHEFISNHEKEIKENIYSTFRSNTSLGWKIGAAAMTGIFALGAVAAAPLILTGAVALPVTTGAFLADAGIAVGGGALFAGGTAKLGYEAAREAKGLLATAAENVISEARKCIADCEAELKRANIKQLNN